MAGSYHVFQHMRDDRLPFIYQDGDSVHKDKISKFAHQSPIDKIRHDLYWLRMKYLHKKAEIRKIINNNKGIEKFTTFVNN